MDVSWANFPSHALAGIMATILTIQIYDKQKEKIGGGEERK